MEIEYSKIIKNESIRREWNAELNKWYFSIVDVVAIVSESTDPRNYWKVLKNRLKNTQKELVTKCNQLKMKANDGKFYLTDTGDEETILKIIKLISPQYLLSFEDYFNKINQENFLNFNSEKNETIRENNEEDSYPQEEMELLIDGYQTDDSIIVKAMVAGVSIQNILISSSAKTLTIKGNREKIKNTSENNFTKDYSNEELYWGKFSRAITLPEEVEINNIVATLHYGMLTIKLKKINKLLSKVIEIKSI